MRGTVAPRAAGSEGGGPAIGRRSLRAALLAASLALVALPHLMIAVSAVAVFETISESDRLQRNKLIVDSLLGQAKAFLQEKRTALGFLGRSIDRGGLPDGALGLPLGEFLAAYPAFETLLVLDSGGRVRAISPEDSDYLGIDFSRQRFFRPGSAAAYWSAPFLSLSTGRPTVGLVVPLESGYLVGNLELSSLGALVAEIELGRTGGAAILDEFGTYLGSRDPGLSLRRQSFPAPGFSALPPAAEVGHLAYAAGGREYLAAARRIAETGWIVVVFQERAEAEAAFRARLQGIGASLVLSLVLAVALVLLGRRPLLDPLRGLAEAAVRISDGNYAGLEGLGRGFEEYETLGRAFADMGGAIRDREAAMKEADRVLLASLEEKEALLKEVHHRVKNNLQVISSMLSLQAAGLDEASGGGAAAFLECQNRVQAMAAAHERLYLSRDLARIDMRDYLEEIANGALESHEGARGKIALDLDCEELSLDIDRAIPLGLVLTEALSNACKHAFPEGRRGTVRVRLRGLDEGGIPARGGGRRSRSGRAPAKAGLLEPGARPRGGLGGPAGSGAPDGKRRSGWIPGRTGAAGRIELKGSCRQRGSNPHALAGSGF